MNSKCINRIALAFFESELTENISTLDYVSTVTVTCPLVVGPTH